MSASGHSRAPESGRAVAAAVLSAMGGQRKVQRFYDADDAHQADVLWCQGAPDVGWNSYSTLNLHGWPNIVNGYDIRIELAGLADSEIETFSEVLAEAAFAIIRDGWFAAPGVVFADIVGEHVSGTTVPHLVWAPPSPWEALNSVSVGDEIDVKWLLAFPVSEPERRAIVAEGFNTIEDRFADLEVEYFDLFRESIV